MGINIESDSQDEVGGTRLLPALTLRGCEVFQIVGLGLGNGLLMQSWFQISVRTRMCDLLSYRSGGCRGDAPRQPNAYAVMIR